MPRENPHNRGQKPRERPKSGPKGPSVPESLSVQTIASKIRENWRLIILAIGLSLMGGDDMMVGKRGSNIKNPPPSSDTKNPGTQESRGSPGGPNAELEVEKRCDEVIKKIEQGFLAFEKLLRPLIEKMTDPFLREQMMMPFEILKINMTNPDENFFRLRNRLAKNGKETSVYRMQNPNWFYYAATANIEPKGVVAGFNPLERSMGISVDFDPQNIMDLLVLLHELVHVSQDTRNRETMGREQYYELYENPDDKKILISNESTAFAFEIEALNLLLKNLIKENSEKGYKTNIEEVADKLNLGDKKELAKMILDLAAMYYPRGIENGQFPEIFVEKVAKIYAKFGYRLFVMAKTGNLVEYVFREGRLVPVK